MSPNIQVPAWWLDPSCRSPACRQAHSEICRDAWRIAIASAMEAECADDFLNELRSTAKRKHAQWTHSRRRVEGSIIRRSFICKWKNICFGLPRGGTSDNKYFDNRCSRQGTPCSSLGDDHCHEHDHAVGYWSQHHYWRKVPNILRDEFGVYLSAKAHTTYTDIYRYIKEPSANKPLGELDAEVYMSPLHPRGEELATPRCWKLGAQCRSSSGHVCYIVWRSSRMITSKAIICKQTRSESK